MCNVQEVNNTTKLMIICVKEEKKVYKKKFRENFLFSGIDSYKTITKTYQQQTTKFNVF